MIPEHIYKIIYGVLFLIFMLIRIRHGKEYKSNFNKKKEGTKREKFLVILVSIGMIIVPVIWLLSNLLQLANIDFPTSVRLIGSIISIYSLWLFYEVHDVLGKNWSPVLEIREGHTLIKEGPYKRIRHPMYTQIWIWVIAQFLITSNWIVGLSGLVPWSILYFVRVPKEEKMMEETFGEAYLEYMEQTGRILPKL
jgi:protein-S-isoprenylcysteine O-methyltransferase Ste14